MSSPDYGDLVRRRQAAQIRLNQAMIAYLLDKLWWPWPRRITKEKARAHALRTLTDEERALLEGTP